MFLIIPMQCLPEILQGKKSHLLSKKKEAVKRIHSTGDLPGEHVFTVAWLESFCCCFYCFFLEGDGRCV